MPPIGWGAVSSRLSGWVWAGISEEMIGCTVAPVREGSGDDRLLVQGAGLCAQMRPPVAHALAAGHRAADDRAKRLDLP